ncbi:LMBR1-like conserved region-containing protein [Trypanosoma rangeli]|uniref:LMBR1-like conserved region-containing protein n=1 Tax=Trypanosoma rangeli TaxID=5698 RepID=A0A422N7Q1_TRYRA|nr:LMBR1-like conserved region-containing protein [Trypanosoma rangeli]RNF01456.1 LMBR1-like conserved region-containing protein [Trypanosoma rangeli]|eukprot:RNF01456.1 LMBR1-like conserved region-containing protein [Trypanosoma rangeli]
MTSAVIVTTIIVGIFLVLFFTLWAMVGYASIAYAYYDVVTPSAKSCENVLFFSYTSHTATLRFKAPLFVYFVALICTIGFNIYIYIYIFGGVGLAAMLVVCILLFRDCPKPIATAECALCLAEMAQESQRFMGDGSQLEQE